MKDASSEFNLGLLACVLGSSAFAKRSLKILFYKHKMSLFYLLKGKISSFWINFLRIKWFKNNSGNYLIIYTTSLKNTSSL